MMADIMNNADEDIDAQAAQWVIRLGGGALSHEEQRAFDHWRNTSAAHDQSFIRARSLWSDLDLGGQTRTARRRRSVSHAATAGIAGFLVLMLSIGGGWVEPERWLADYTTSTGEIRTVSLTDGSFAVLDTHAALNVRYNDKERRIVLLGGQAYFTVAPIARNEHRPFVVEAAGGTSTALGTQFMVSRLGSEVDMVVTEHSVRVTASDRDAVSKSVTVLEGRAVHYGREGLNIPHDVSAQALSSWRNGQLVFDNEELDQVVERLNQYRHGRIILANRDLAGRRVSGVFMCNDVAGAVATISNELGAKNISVGKLVTIMY